MTTICYRDGVLAADSKCSHGDVLGCYVRKIATCDRGIGGAAGKLVDFQRFVIWINAGAEDSPPDAENADGIFVQADGTTMLWDGTNHLIEVNAPFFAFGSGHQVALGAMQAGASAIEAVEIAKMIDNGTGGPTQVLALADREFREISCDEDAQT